MKKILTFVAVFLTVSILYITIDTAFEVYSSRQIVIGLFATITIIMLYFSLRKCFCKKD